MVDNMLSIGNNLEIYKGMKKFFINGQKKFVNIDYTVILRENQILLRNKKLGV
ncbi:hypothetical protein [Metabacillus fastidiosus]|uniref:hypothetical protein n=1 Tax=Metabacillus fastidiosus TaxID=1458 RepID=UPI003D26C3E6